MKYAQLGKTDLVVSRICFGCWQLSPKFWGEIPLDEWRAALNSALEVGVNFIDTADAYGDGLAEEELGRWLEVSKARDRLVIATKFYHNFETEVRHPDTSHDYILRACEASLRRLRTDRIDLYQIHAWDPLTRPDEVASALGRLKKEGKVRRFGVSNLNSDQLRMYLRYLDVECLQPLYNLLDRDVEAHELPLCLEQRIGVIAYSPLARGLLAGRYNPDQQFDDHRAGAWRFKGRAFERLLAGIDKLRPLAEANGLTVAQFAVRWVLTHPAITSAIVGVKKPEHIMSIAPAADGTLSIPEWHEAAAIIAEAQADARSQE